MGDIVTKIVFLKTHKTASSTLQNILMRFGEKMDLKFALPSNSGARFSYPSPLKSYMIKQLPNNEPVDILCHHSVSNKDMKTVIPGAKLITIVRSIPSLYESSFGYFLNEVREYKAAKTIDSFYSDPKKWYNPSRRNALSQFAHNHLAFDLGYSTEVTEDAEIERIANAIVSAYHLILISDYFFESMILLKQTFCWDWIDVLYFVTTQRADHKELSEDLTTKIIEWNNIDQKIFEKANSTFWLKYNEIPNLQLLEDEFRIEIEKVKEFCLLDEGRECHGSNDPKCSKSIGVKLKGLALRPEAEKSQLCQNMILPELEYTKRLFKKQWPGWTNFYG